MPAHRATQHQHGDKVPSAVSTAEICRKILRKRRLPRSAVVRKWRKAAIYSIWHAGCYNNRVHLVPRHEGAVQRFSGPAAPPFLVSDLGGDQLLQLAAL